MTPAVGIMIRGLLAGMSIQFQVVQNDLQSLSLCRGRRSYKYRTQLHALYTSTSAKAEGSR